MNPQWIDFRSAPRGQICVAPYPSYAYYLHCREPSAPYIEYSLYPMSLVNAFPKNSAPPERNRTQSRTLDLADLPVYRPKN